MSEPQLLETGAPDPQRAWQLLRLHRPSLALQMSEQLLAQNPASLPALLARVEALRQLQQLPAAVEAAEAAIAAAPQSAEAFAAGAQVVGQLGELGRAEQLMAEALRLNPLSAGYHGFLAQLCYLQQRRREAIAHAEAGLRLNAQHPDCLLWRALAQEQLDQPTAADADFHRVLHMAPTSALVHEWRGRLLLQRYEPQQAALHLTEALRLTPNNRGLVLPLRQARLQQLWPAWLLRLHQKRRQDWSNGFPFSWRGPAAGLPTPFFQLRSWWRLRHDPLVRETVPGYRATLLRKWLVIIGLTVSIGGFLYAYINYELPPYSIIFALMGVLRLFIDQHKKKED